MNSLAPWLHSAARELNAGRIQERLPHALLVTGAAGIGKRALSDWLVRLLHCRQATAEGACGECDSCRLHDTGSHPDMTIVEPEAVGKEIKIDAIRATCFDLALTARYAGYRVLLIDPADAMNRNAANALLKTLEEPSPNTLIILLSDRPNSMPATVLSRCRKIRLGAPGRAIACEWLMRQSEIDATRAGRLLTAAQGAPYQALAMNESDAAGAGRVEALIDLIEQFTESHQEFAQTTESMSKYTLAEIRLVVMAWISGHVRRQVVAAPNVLASGRPGALLFELWDDVLYWPIDRNSGLDQRLLIEETLIRLRRAIDTNRRNSQSQAS